MNDETGLDCHVGFAEVCRFHPSSFIFHNYFAHVV
jgi:hypothetical protein